MGMFSCFIHLLVLGLLLGFASIGTPAGRVSLESYHVSLTAPAVPIPNVQSPSSAPPPPPPPKQKRRVPPPPPPPPKDDPDRMADWWSKNKPKVSLPKLSPRVSANRKSPTLKPPPASTLPGEKSSRPPTPREETPFWKKDSDANGRAPSEAPAPPPSASVEGPKASVSVKGDAADHPYTNVVQGKISERWAPPAVDMSGKDLIVEVGFYIRRDGSVGEVKVKKSSGNPFFDQAALRAVFLARPFPPLSQWTEESSVFFHVRFFKVGGLS